MAGGRDEKCIYIYTPSPAWIFSVFKNNIIGIRKSLDGNGIYIGEPGEEDVMPKISSLTPATMNEVNEIISKLPNKQDIAVEEVPLFYTSFSNTHHQ